MVRKAKMKKDANAPKRPLSGYFQFTAVARKQLVAENPDLKMTEVGSKLAQAWKQLTDDEKAPYSAKYKADKVVYDRKLAAYKLTPEYEEYQVAKKAFNKKKKAGAAKANLKAMTPNMPKRPQSGYFLYVADNRARAKASLEVSNPGYKITEVTKKLGAEWQAMDVAAKKQYQDKAAVAKKVYQDAMDDYKLTEEYQAYLVAKNPPKKAKKKKRRSSMGTSSQEDY